MAAVAAAASGVSYAADTGTTGAVVKSAGGPRVTLLHPGVLPNGVSSLPHGGAAPALERTVGEVGDIGKAGDVYLVDTTGIAEDAHANLYVTNLRDVARSLRSFALPVGLWSSRSSSTWRRDADERYLTSSDGHVELTLLPGRLYTVSLERGGSWFGSRGAPVAPRLYLAVT